MISVPKALKTWKVISCAVFWRFAARRAMTWSRMMRRLAGFGVKPEISSSRILSASAYSALGSVVTPRSAYSLIGTTSQGGELDHDCERALLFDAFKDGFDDAQRRIAHIALHRGEHVADRQRRV